METRNEKYMGLALMEAEIALEAGHVPIGAILVIDDKLIARAHNTTKGGDWTNHAETNLIRENAPLIKSARKNSLEVAIYSTLEPCLQCFGAIVHNRVGRLIYGCPDPVAGATSISPPTEWYREKWPDITREILRGECYDIFVNYMKGKESWGNVLPHFERMREDWE